MRDVTAAVRAGAEFGHRAEIPFLGWSEAVEADTKKTSIEVGESGSGGLRDITGRGSIGQRLRIERSYGGLSIFDRP